MLSQSPGPQTAGHPARAVLTPEECAALLGVNVNELRYRFAHDTVPFPVRKIGRRWLIPRGPFFAWLEGTPAGDAGTCEIATERASSAA